MNLRTFGFLALLFLCGAAQAQSCTPSGAAMSSLAQWRQACTACGGQVVGSGSSMQCKFPSSGAAGAAPGGMPGGAMGQMMGQMSYNLGYAIGSAIRNSALEREQQDALAVERARQERVFQEQARRLLEQQESDRARQDEALRDEEKRAESQRREQIYQRVSGSLFGGEPSHDTASQLGLIGVGSSTGSAMDELRSAAAYGERAREQNGEAASATARNVIDTPAAQARPLEQAALATPDGRPVPETPRIAQLRQKLADNEAKRAFLARELRELQNSPQRNPVAIALKKDEIARAEQEKSYLDFSLRDEAAKAK